LRIVDVCAFYTPHGGGVKTYVEQKMRIGPELGHEIIILAPVTGMR
jgi:alpha-1,6-mannosyltransferase